MPYKVQRDEYSFDYPPSTVNRANGGFTKDDAEVIGRWVQRDESDGTLRLLGDKNRPFGVINTLGPTKVGVAVGPVVKGKQAGTAALKIGLGVIGATRVVATGMTAERGFVTEQGTPASNTADDVSAVANKVGQILSSEATTVETEGDISCEVLMYSG